MIIRHEITAFDRLVSLPREQGNRVESNHEADRATCRRSLRVSSVTNPCTSSL